MIGERNNVVVHFKNGDILKGFSHDFLPERLLFHLHVELGPKTGQILEVKISDLKAIFFTKTYEGDKEYHEKKRFEEIESKTYHGIKIKVEFKDGEIIRGTSLGYNKRKNGFFIIPVDPIGNNNRIYVIADATAQIVVGPNAEQ